MVLSVSYDFYSLINLVKQKCDVPSGSIQEC
jgi:hypothetical protein